MTQIVIVDDHELLSETLCIALRRVGLDATHVVPDAPAQLLAAILDHDPQLVLLDLELGQFGDSTPLIAPLIAAGPSVLIVTGMPDRLRIAAALEQGALGYRLKSDGFDSLVDAARRLHDRRTPLDLDERFELLEELRVSRREREQLFGPFRLLSVRERATLRALGHGCSVHQIAHTWVVSEATVRSHVRGILTKLNAPSQLAAVARAVRSGWLAEQDVLDNEE